MRTKALAALAVAGALAFAALGVRQARWPQAPPPPPPMQAEGFDPGAPSPAQEAPAVPARAAAPAATVGVAAAPDLAQPTVIEAVVAPAPAPRPRLQPMQNVSGYLANHAQTGAIQINAAPGDPAAGVAKAAEDLARQVQALALQNAAQPAPQAMTQQAVMLQLLPTSTLEEFRYSVVNLDAKPVDDVRIITPEKTWKLGRLAPGQTSEIVSAAPLLQVKVHYVTVPK